MIIREAVMNDLEVLLPLFIEGYIFHYDNRKDIFIEQPELALRDLLIDNLCSTDKKTLILIDAEEVIGYIQYEIKMNRKDKVLWIHELVIKNEKRHMGYAKKLMEKIEQVAKDMKVKRIELNCWNFNTDALKMYEKLGFNTQRIVLEKTV